MRAHGVNVAMALKTSALWSLVSGEAADRDGAIRALDVLDRHHGQPNGMFSADEHHAGQDPSQGTELCAVVESLYSLQHVVAVNGDVALADRIERMAYNAMPATMSADMWSHQYDQQANQVICSLNRRRWVSNGPESNLFGLEPNFGCCTANLHQGWPKLVGSLWMATPDNGLAAVVYAPSTVKARVGAAGQVTIRQVTDYPFSGVITLTVTPSVNRLKFPLQLRIPSWAEGATVTLEWRAGGRRHARRLRPDRTAVEPRGDRPHHAADARARVRPGIATRWPWNADRWCSRCRSARTGGASRRGMKKPAPAPAADWEVLPTTPWNYGLRVGASGATGRRAGHVARRSNGRWGRCRLRARRPPVEIEVTGRRVPEWQVGGRLGGHAPAEPRGEPREGRDAAPGALRDRAATNHGVSADRVICVIPAIVARNPQSCNSVTRRCPSSSLPSGSRSRARPAP